ncbi:MAG TPA: hypothetical protein VHD57_16230 [Vicinamibacterales bacterium]|nr:hypothetical protein [Vicinamibacterales bacterium]
MRAWILTSSAALATVAALSAQSLPVPRPFPGAGGPPESGATEPAPASRRQPADPARPPATTSAPATSTPAPAASADAPPANLPVYPAADFLESYDAGHGQRYYLYGTDAAYDTIVQYYRNTLRAGGREIFEQPPTRQFDLGRFDDDHMSFPPSVVVKDYTWNGSTGYLYVSGATEKRYKTIIQIVPPVTPGQ